MKQFNNLEVKKMERTTNNFVKRWKKYLKDFYGEKAVEWRDEMDDRKLFSNIYFQIVDALNELEKIEPINSVYIKVAISDSIINDEKTLNDILTVFVK